MKLKDKSAAMSFREAIGLGLAVVGAALVPLGWMISATIFVVAFALFAVGLALFFTKRRLKRAEEIENESVGRRTSGSEVPVDMHNYTGWRSGGRRQDMESSSESGGTDGD